RPENAWASRLLFRLSSKSLAKTCKSGSRKALLHLALESRHRHFRAIHALVWHTVNLRSAHLAPIIRTSEHFHVFSPPPRWSVRMFGSGGKKRANASSNCAAR